ncbi:23S rRNA (guanosine2251-2'-O)-methyltransferase [Alkalispirochaeta americana]|uniref:23S rRNA (Guanosine2251-2'-O)-methyltransferase n=1 Tax=Alkalispirochaeta americana TaxID=159291 RepID=A0A1N6W2B2_9SPIO|nr:RNA methyltransferase [Alkalispirochaeta americana]SIQ84214.1 23S rRNA (guanosine2251-2'-O)-methyltransferase [Alkalispirochaeta americana]
MSWITSRHAIEATLQREAPGAVLYLTDLRGRNGDLQRLARSRGVGVKTVSGEWLRKRAGSSARGAALELGESPSRSSVVSLKDWLRRTPPGSTGPILALDHVTDPHNVGAILRTAYLMGVPLVIVPARRSVLDSDGVRRSSAGASDEVPVAVVPNLASALRECKRAGWWVYAADAGGTPLPEVPFDSAAVLLLGAEGKGVSPGAAALSDLTVSIPDRAPGGTTVDSFNVSVAAGILTYEYFRTVQPE